jgi:crotonobetainyl-CoA:carnitine CoA-transferase CaiB-like acyl-CoA transferase
MAPQPRPYDGLRVIELADDPGGEMTGYLLAGMGADVIKVEPPEGSPTRGVGPFAGNEPDPDNSLTFWYYNGNKRSVVIDYGSAAGRGTLRDMLADADLFVCTLPPAALAEQGLDYPAICERHPELIIVAVTPFGLDGPWSAYRSSDLVALAAGGPLHMCGYDDHTIPPIRPGGNQAYHTVASFAHKAALVALLDRQQCGLGQIVDVSMHEACAVTVELANPYWFYPRAIVHRQTCRHAQPVPTQPALFECADGRYIYFVLVVSEQKPWSSLVEWLDSRGMAADLQEPAFAEFRHRQAHYDHVQGLVECFFLLMDADTAFHEGQARGLPIGIVNAPEDLFADAHFRQRGFFVDVDHGEAGTFEYPGSPYRFSAFDAVPRQRAPRLGEHTGQVLSSLADSGDR